MLQVITQFTIQQNPTTDFPTRNNSFYFTFANSVEIESSWKNLTQKAKIKFPKNIFVFGIDANGPYQLFNINITQANGNPTSGSGTPMILRGDKITIRQGYVPDSSLNPIINTTFAGYVSMINNRMPVELECEDNMFVLGNTTAKGTKNGTYTGSINDMMTDLLSGTGFTVNTNQELYQLGTFRIVGTQSIRQVLKKLCEDYKIDAYFAGAELRIGTLPYYPLDPAMYGSTTKPKILDFQFNIIKDDLRYARQENTNLLIQVNAVTTLAGTSKSGTNINGSNRKSRSKVIATAGTPGGETMIINVPTGAGQTQSYFQGIANNMIKKYNNSNWWKGKVITFGLPQILVGDAIQLVDRIITERNGGIYMVKSVKTTMTITGGFRQEIELDLRVDNDLKITIPSKYIIQS